MVEKEKNPHESEWISLEKKYRLLSKTKDDIYFHRAESCASLIKEFC